jgi:hypothetical protein
VRLEQEKRLLKGILLQLDEERHLTVTGVEETRRKE